MPDGLNGPGIVEVEDTNEAYGQIAAYHRSRFSKLRVVGVTGSNGKSTTKEMIAAVLSSRFRVLKNEGTLNNLVGVPQTLCRLDSATDIAVLEMGSSFPGEISKLSAIVQPEVGVLTNVGPSHLEYFGDLDGVAKEKGALAEALSDTGRLVLNADDPRTWALRFQSKAAFVGYGWESGEPTDVTARDVVCNRDGTWSFTACFERSGEHGRVDLPLLGRHNVANALAAMAVGEFYGVGIPDMVSVLRAFHGLKMRMESFSLGTVRVINDAYNANPQSLARAVEVLNEVPAQGKKIVVLGDMLELGEAERRIHEEAGGALASSSVSVLICVGARASWAAETFRREKRLAQEVVQFKETSEASGFLSQVVADGDVILLKGSRGMALERVLNDFGLGVATGGGRPCF